MSGVFARDPQPLSLGCRDALDVEMGYEKQRASRGGLIPSYPLHSTSTHNSWSLGAGAWSGLPDELADCDHEWANDVTAAGNSV